MFGLERVRDGQESEIRRAEQKSRGFGLWGESEDQAFTLSLQETES